MTTFKRARRLDVERSCQVIEALGGTLKLSREFGIRHPSVSNWKKYGIPEARLQLIQMKYKRVPAVKKTLDFHPWKDR